jgi:hypothetical protein
MFNNSNEKSQMMNFISLQPVYNIPKPLYEEWWTPVNKQNFAHKDRPEHMLQNDQAPTEVNHEYILT